MIPEKLPSGQAMKDAKRAEDTRRSRFWFYEEAA